MSEKKEDSNLNSIPPIPKVDIPGIPQMVIPVIGESTKPKGRPPGSKSKKKTTISRGKSRQAIIEGAVEDIIGEKPSDAMEAAIVNKIKGGQTNFSMSEIMKPFMEGMKVQGMEYQQLAMQNMMDTLREQMDRRRKKQNGQEGSGNPLFNIDLSKPENIEVVKNLDPDMIMKINMMNSKNPLATLLLMGMDKNKEKMDPFMQQLMGVMIQNMFAQKQQDPNQMTFKDMMEFMMGMMKMNQQPQNGNEMLYKTLVDMMDKMSQMKTEFLSEKISELQQGLSQDPFQSLKNNLSVVKDLQALTGAPNPEMMQYQLTMKKLDHDLMREERQEERNQQAMNVWSDLIGNTVKTVTDTIGPSVGEGLKQQLNQRMNMQQMPMFPPNPAYNGPPQTPMIPNIPTSPMPQDFPPSPIDNTGILQQLQPQVTEFKPNPPIAPTNPTPTLAPSASTSPINGFSFVGTKKKQ